MNLSGLLQPLYEPLYLYLIVVSSRQLPIKTI
jgi:hypothetical protein